MANAVKCDSRERVRSQIDRIDGLMLGLLDERGVYVKQAACLKVNAIEIPAPQRVEQVIGRVAGFARELGVDPVVAEATWHAMITTFIQDELAEHARLHPPST